MEENFILTAELRQQILSVLAELPLKHGYAIVQKLVSLQPIPKEEENKKGG